MDFIKELLSGVLGRFLSVLLMAAGMLLAAFATDFNDVAMYVGGAVGLIVYYVAKHFVLNAINKQEA